MSNTDDPTLTLLEERFFDSDYRRSLLDDLLRRGQNEFAVVGIVEIIRSIPTRRSWIVLFEQQRIEFFPNNIQHLENVDCLSAYLKTFYAGVERENASLITAPPTFCVSVSPHDTEWLKAVSARMKNANTARKE